MHDLVVFRVHLSPLGEGGELDCFEARPEPRCRRAREPAERFGASVSSLRGLANAPNRAGKTNDTVEGAPITPIVGDAALDRRNRTGNSQAGSGNLGDSGPAQAREPGKHNWNDELVRLCDYEVCAGDVAGDVGDPEMRLIRGEEGSGVAALVQVDGQPFPRGLRSGPSTRRLPVEVMGLPFGRVDSRGLDSRVVLQSSELLV